MGCWDIYCLLCGNPQHGSFDTLKEQFDESVEHYETIADSKNKKNKWFINYFSPIYEQYKKNPTKFIDSIKSINKRTSWLNKCTFLGADGSINHGCKEVSCNISFVDKKNNQFIAQTFFEDLDIKYGVFVHTDCWKFIKQEYGIKLQYKHLPINKISIVEKKVLPNIDYGQMEKYWGQDFDFIQMISDGNEELSSSPLKSNLTAKNINKIFSKLKIRNDLQRKGPIVSASFYKPGTYRLGESFLLGLDKKNGGIWMISGGKWIEIKQTVKILIDIDNLNLIKNVSFAQDVNSEPIFIIKIVNKTIHLITTPEFENKIMKKIR
jgi:hypothetical protein